MSLLKSFRSAVCATAILLGVGAVGNSRANDNADNIVTWYFAGTMSGGESFDGWFTFDPTTLDQSPTTPLRGDYYNAGVDWLVNVGGTIFTSVSATAGWTGTIEIINDAEPILWPGDNFRIYADARPVFYHSSLVNGWDLHLSDVTGALVNDVALPLTPPDLSLVSLGGWSERNSLQWAAEFQLEANGTIVDRGQITSVSALVP